MLTRARLKKGEGKLASYNPKSKGDFVNVRWLPWERKEKILP
jgi:hypothetical protein